MIKQIASLAALTASATLAHAQPLPAPPMQTYTPVQTASCDSQTLQVYFQAGESDLNAASKALLKAAQDQLHGCIVGPVSLQATAEDADTATQAETLAEARLETVTAALEDFDLAGTRLQASYEPSATPNSLAAPMTRSVEVRLSAWAPQIG
ncbi:MAG: hypothetical protein AAFQ12_09155 [Pseudomonadota bacterium]